MTGGAADRCTRWTAARLRWLVPSVGDVTVAWVVVGWVRRRWSDCGGLPLTRVGAAGRLALLDLLVGGWGCAESASRARRATREGNGGMFHVKQAGELLTAVEVQPRDIEV